VEGRGFGAEARLGGRGARPSNEELVTRSRY
jgi:hypothetical protein